MNSVPREPEDLVRALGAAGIRDERLLEAVRTTPRAEFVPAGQVAAAYRDAPVAIGQGQVTTQPSLSAMMIESLGLVGNEHVLEIGTGLGFQTALLARLAADVVSIEMRPDIARQAHGSWYETWSCGSATAAAACRTALRTTRSSSRPRSRRYPHR